MTTVTETKKVIASESGHWYTKSGEPCYEVPRAKGDGMRPTTLRDARKLGLVPSVTSVLQILARPGLDAWKQNNILLSAATAPHDAQTLGADKWAELVLSDAREQAEKAMQLGTDIHADIEGYLSFGDTPIEKLHGEFTVSVIEEMISRGMLQNWKSEKSFAHPIGFGGKIDFYNDEWLIDFKTKAFIEEDISKGLAYPEHVYQLAAYRYGIQKPHLKCMNIFISTTSPGLFHFHEWTEEEVKNGCAVFLKTLELWKLIKGM